jgi:glycosyltransferase involved in cell wall biosynthesis
VLSFDSGGTPEVVKDGFNGYIVRDMNAESLSRAILTAYDDRAKLKKMGKNAALNIKKEFTIEKQMKQIGSVMEAFIK